MHKRIISQRLHWQVELAGFNQSTLCLMLHFTSVFSGESCLLNVVNKTLVFATCIKHDKHMHRYILWTMPRYGTTCLFTPFNVLTILRFSQISQIKFLNSVHTYIFSIARAHMIRTSEKVNNLGCVSVRLEIVKYSFICYFFPSELHDTNPSATS